MATRAEQIRAQRTIFDAFRKRTLHVKFWSRAMLTPLELELLFQKQDKYENALRIIASNDDMTSGDIAREALGLSMPEAENQ